VSPPVLVVLVSPLDASPVLVFASPVLGSAVVVSAPVVLGSGSAVVSAPVVSSPPDVVVASTAAVVVDGSPVVLPVPPAVPVASVLVASASSLVVPSCAGGASVDAADVMPAAGGVVKLSTGAASQAATATSAAAASVAEGWRERRVLPPFARHISQIMRRVLVCSVVSGRVVRVVAGMGVTLAFRLSVVAMEYRALAIRAESGIATVDKSCVSSRSRCRDLPRGATRAGQREVQAGGLLAGEIGAALG